MHIIEIIGELVDRIRDTAAISNIVDNGNGTYTITADPKDLSNDDYVSIFDTVGFNNPTDQTDVNSAGYKISNVTATGFNITKTSGTAIPATFGTYKANAPYYGHGYWIKEDRELAQKQGSNKYRDQMFPLIFLLEPVPETRQRLITSPRQLEAPIKIYFFIDTDENKNSDWSNDNNKPILLDLEDKFMRQLRRISNDEIESTLLWIPFDSGVEFRFVTPVDTIETDYGTLNIDEIC
jgi:hypothetical protein